MTELQNLLKKSGVEKAVIIDDMFDAVPRPYDINEDDWSIFFDDLGEDGNQFLADLYLGYDETDQSELTNVQEFVSVVWENRKELIVCDRLFKEYETTKANELKMLNTLVAALENLGLVCTTMGREPDERAKEADLIIIDLFLGYQQSEDDIDRAVHRVKELIKDRVQNPPLVILMSRSHRLWDKRNDFRDNAGLLGSIFRVVSKADLANPSKLERLLRRLASHYEDAKRVAGFIHAWDSGLDQARKKFIQILRRLDLSDLAQIRALLLDFEGQLLGEYLLDVADRVLQHEIEGNSETIESALELNKIDLSKYPAPHLAGSSNLQDLVHRMVFLHSDRLRLSEEDKFQLQFGDLLCWKSEDGTAFSDDVSLVVTPACDLVRNDGIGRVMLLSGKFESLEPKNWAYKEGPVRTAIVILPDEKRKWIRWNLKDSRVLSRKEIHDLINKESKLSRVGRLRDVYAIEIQQRMLADMGRIGQPANPPATFPVSISLFIVTANGTACLINVPKLTETVCFCFVGRGDSPERIDHLVLSESACDALQDAIRKLSPDDIHELARKSLEAMKEDLDFFERFERGIRVPVKDNKLEAEEGRNNLIYMHFVRNEWAKETESIRGNHRKAPLVIKICDIPSTPEA